MNATAGIETSALLQTLRDQGLRVTYASFMKWRQQGLIPDPILDESGKAERKGLGRGRGRVEARWPPTVLQQVAKICRLREQRHRFDQIAVELWLSGYAVNTKRVKQALLAEWARFVYPLETYLYRREGRSPADDTVRARTLDGLARKLARRARRGFDGLPRSERKAAEDAWRQIAAAVLPGPLGREEIKGGRRILSDLGFPPDLAALVECPESLGTFSGLLSQRALEAALTEAETAANLLARARHQAIFAKFIIDLPELPTSISPQFDRLLRVTRVVLVSVPETVWVSILVIKLHRTGEGLIQHEHLSRFESLLGEIRKSAGEASLEMGGRFLAAIQDLLSLPQAERQESTAQRG